MYDNYCVMIYISDLLYFAAMVNPFYRNCHTTFIWGDFNGYNSKFIPMLICVIFWDLYSYVVEVVVIIFPS